MQPEDKVNIVYDLNSLYNAYLAAKKESDWKPQVQNMKWIFSLVLLKASQI